MRKNITEEKFLQIAKKHRENGIITCIKERGQAIFVVTKHVMCRAEKSENSLVLNIHPKKGWGEEALTTISKNSFMNELLENCYC